MQKEVRFYFFIIAALFFYEFLNGLYIWLGKDFSEFYQFNLLAPEKAFGEIEKILGGHTPRN